jgi:hypothetical protein
MLAEADLITALKRIRPQTARGFYSRLVELRHLSSASPRQAPGRRVLWGLGSKLYGGRFTPKGSFEAIYLSEDPVTAMAEVNRIFDSARTPIRVTAQPPQVLITVEGVLHRVLDLTVSGIQGTLGTNLQELVGDGDRFKRRGRRRPRKCWGGFVTEVSASRPFGFHRARTLRTVCASRFSPIGCGHRR